MKKEFENELSKFLKREQPWKYNFEFECNDREYENLSTFRRYFTYKILPEPTDYPGANEFIKEQSGCTPACDPDGSGRAYYPLTHAIYARLWNWKRDKGTTFGKISKSPFGNETEEFGGDTMNSVQTALGFTHGKNRYGKSSLYWTLECWYQDKETYEKEWKKIGMDRYIDSYHTLGNFVLVPAGFNRYRGKDNEITDFWDLSLEYLKRNGYEGSKKYKDFDKNEFAWYINYFFLWDYVKVEDGEYQVRHIGMNQDKKNERNFSPAEPGKKNFFQETVKLIERRGKFMTAMLIIAQENIDLYTKIHNSLANREDGREHIVQGGIAGAAREILSEHSKEFEAFEKGAPGETREIKRAKAYLEELCQ